MSEDLGESANSAQSLTYSQLSPQQKRQRLQELARIFFKLGTIAFGGPAAHIAMMEDEVVKRRQWLSREQLLDLLGVTSLLPGPNSTELAIHIGYDRAGWWGLFIAGSCFILPAMTTVWLLAAVYTRYQTIPQISGLLYGIKPAIAVIVAFALWKLSRKAIKSRLTAIAGIGVIVAFAWGINEILLLLIAGLSVMLIQNWQRRNNLIGAWLLPLVAVSQANSSPSANPATWWRVWLFFLKVGSVLYGSGYVLLAFLQRDLVDRWHWLTSQQLLDAVAVGQLTPGPVFTTATFVGYLLAGNLGAIAATVGIFLPAFLLVGIVNPWIPKLRRSPWASGFLDGVNAASLGLMAVVTYTLTQTALLDWLTILLAIISAIALLKFKIQPAWLVIFGGIVGLLRDYLT